MFLRTGPGALASTSLTGQRMPRAAREPAVRLGLPLPQLSPATGGTRRHLALSGGASGAASGGAHSSWSRGSRGNSLFSTFPTNTKMQPMDEGEREKELLKAILFKSHIVYLQQRPILILTPESKATVLRGPPRLSPEAPGHLPGTRAGLPRCAQG